MKDMLFFPSQPGCLLLKRYGNALQARNGRETDIEDRNDMLTWRKPKPLLDTWIVGRVPCAPHTSESQLFSSQQHVLDSRSRSLDILDLQHLWLVGRFSHYYNDYGRAQKLSSLFVQYCLRFVAGCFFQSACQRLRHDCTK